MLKDINIRQRMLGAITLISLVVIFLPFILDGEGLKLILPKPQAISIPKETPINLAISNTRQVTEKIEKEYKKLEVASKKVAIPSNTANTEKLNLTAWAIQIATYKQQQTAKNIVEKLLKKSFNAYIEKSGSVATPLYKVKIGPVPTKKEANKILKNIAKQLKVKPLIVRYP